MTEKKEALPSLKNHDWEKIRSETKKVNRLLKNIPLEISQK